MPNNNTELNFNENFSLTRELTHLTNNWYQDTIKPNISWGTLLLGSAGSRALNILITPTALLTSISHLAIGIFTLGIGAPLGKVYNFIQLSLNRRERSSFSFAGGLINIMNAKKHLASALVGTLVGIINPEKAANFYKSYGGKSKAEVTAIFQQAINVCDRMIWNPFIALERVESYIEIKKVLEDYCLEDFNEVISGTTLEGHEKFSFTESLTTITNKWYQKANEENASFGSILLGKAGSRLVNFIMIETLSIVDTINNLALAIFTLGIGAHVNLVCNFVEWKLNYNYESRISYSGGLVNLTNAKMHLINGPIGSIAGLLDPEKAANFYRTNDGRTRKEGRKILKKAMRVFKFVISDENNSPALRSASQHILNVLASKV